MLPERWNGRHTSWLKMKIANQIHRYAPMLHPARADKGAPEGKHSGVGTTPAAPASPAGSPARSCPSWLKKAIFSDDTAVLSHKRGAIDRPVNKLRENMHRHLDLRWTHDRSAAFNQIGPQSYADKRQQELQSIPGAGYLAEQYGLRTVKNQVSVEPPHPQQHSQHGLKINHDLSAEYQRDSPHPELRKQCLNIYQAQGHTHPAERVLFVNSKTKAKRILARLRHADWKAASTRIDRWKIAAGMKRKHLDVKPLHPGLVAIEFKRGGDAIRSEKLLQLLGGRPSSHEVGKLDYQVRNPAQPRARLERQIDNHSTLREALNDQICELKSLPDWHAMGAVANCAICVLAGLQTALDKKAQAPEFKHSVLIENVLGTLKKVAGSLPTLADDSASFFPAYGAMMEELHLLLACVKPYDATDFKKAASAMLKERAGQAFETLNIAEPETYLLSSGMDAISTGIDIARKLSGAKRTQPLAQMDKLPDYFETLDLQSEGRTWLDKDRIRFATLNPSRPWTKEGDGNVNSWNAEKLAQQALAWLDIGKVDAGSPAVLVLDTTIEKPGQEGTSDLAPVLAKLQPYIDDGRLKIVLCKSFQKYTSLGSAKIMAGGVTVIAKDDAKTQAAAARLQKAEKDLGWMHNDESQLLTHLMTHAHAGELALIGESARNAAFIDKFCFDAVRGSGQTDVHREEGLPFVIVENGALHEGKPLLARQVEYRDSFGFLGTTMLDVTDEGAGLRITAGRETREELVEKLYGFAWQHETGLETFTPADAANTAKRIAADAMQVVFNETDVMSWAPTALLVLGGRENPAQAKCRALVDEIVSMSKDTDAHSGNALEERKALLKQELGSALAQSGAEHLLTDQIRVVGGAFAPRLARDALLHENDLDAIRMAMRRPDDRYSESSSELSDYTRARYASNAIASLLAMSGMAFGPENIDDDARQELQFLYSAVLSGGLPGVSPATQAHIVLDWSRLHREKLDAPDPAARRAAVHELLIHARLAPYRETGAKMLAEIPDSTFARLDESSQQQLIEVLFAPLDIDSRRLCIELLERGNEPKKMQACVKRLDAEVVA